MKIYTIKSPFLCREGQFTEGKRDLCVGIEKFALVKDGNCRIYLGSNKSSFYDLTMEKLQEFYKQVGRVHIFNRGRVQLYIVPLFICEHGETKFDHEEYHKKEAERDKAIQARLF